MLFLQLIYSIGREALSLIIVHHISIVFSVFFFVLFYFLLHFNVFEAGEIVLCQESLRGSYQFQIPLISVGNFEHTPVWLSNALAQIYGTSVRMLPLFG